MQLLLLLDHQCAGAIARASIGGGDRQSRAVMWRRRMQRSSALLPNHAFVRDVARRDLWPPSGHDCPGCRAVHSLDFPKVAREPERGAGQPFALFSTGFTQPVSDTGVTMPQEVRAAPG